MRERFSHAWRVVVAGPAGSEISTLKVLIHTYYVCILCVNGSSPQGEQEDLVSGRSSLTIECNPIRRGPRPSRYCMRWGGSSMHSASASRMKTQDVNARCSGCSTCVTSSKASSQPINMPLVAHVTGKRPFFFEGELVLPLTPAKVVRPPEIPQKYPYKREALG